MTTEVSAAFSSRPWALKATPFSFCNFGATIGTDSMVLMIAISRVAVKVSPVMTPLSSSWLQSFDVGAKCETFWCYLRIDSNGRN